MNSVGKPVGVFRPFTIRDGWKLSTPGKMCQTSMNRTHKRNYLCEMYLSDLTSISIQQFYSYE